MSNQMPSTVKNSLYSGGSWALVTLSQFVVMPVLVAKLGIEGFGIYATLLAVIGYMGVMELGIGQALIKFISHFLALGEVDKAKEALWTAVTFFLAIGAAASLLIWLGSDVIVDFINVSASRVDETRLALSWTGVAFAVALVMGAFSAVPAALQNFKLVGVVSFFLGVGTQVAGLVIVLMGFGLPPLIYANIVISFFFLTAYLTYTLRSMPGSLCLFRWSPSAFRRLFSFGGYYFVGRVANLTGNHLVKLLIAAMLGPSAVTYFTIPQRLAGLVPDFLGRLGIIWFPRVSALKAADKGEEIWRSYLRAGQLVALTASLLFLPIFLVPGFLIRLWMGSKLSAICTPMAFFLAATYYISSFSQIPTYFAYGLGKVKIVAAFSCLVVAANLVFLPIGMNIGGFWGLGIAFLMARFAAPYYIFTMSRLVSLRREDLNRYLRLIARIAWPPSLAVGVTFFLYMQGINAWHVFAPAWAALVIVCWQAQGVIPWSDIKRVSREVLSWTKSSEIYVAEK